MTDFEKQVLEDLAQLKTHMYWIVGNGKPGRLQELGDRVDRHEAFVQRAGGIGAALAGLLTMLHVGIDFMRLHAHG